MQRLSVKTSELAQGLELGVGDTRNYFAALPLESRLRFGACGLLATAVKQYLDTEGIPSRLVMTSPKLEIDPGMQHVFSIVELDSGITVLDPTYSQFLRYFGIGLIQGSLVPSSNFPSEKIAVFNLEEKAQKIQSIASLAVLSAGKGVADEVERVFEAVWNIDSVIEWSPPEYAHIDATVINKRLTPGLMRIISEP